MNESSALRIDASLLGTALRFKAGCIHVIAGPADAGKSTLLRRIAGLDRGAGRIEFAGRALDRLAPSARGVRWFAPAPDESTPAVRLQVLEDLLADRPDVLLLDEPTRGFDAAQQGAWLSTAARRCVSVASGAVMLVAARDPSVALDLIVPDGLPVELVLLQGRHWLAQGAGLELLADPDSLELATLACRPALNTLAARAERNHLVIIDGPRLALIRPVGAPGDAVTVAWHPDDLRLDGQGGDLAFDVLVTGNRFDGRFTEIAMQARCGPLVMRRPGFCPHRRHERLRVHLDPGAIMVFDAAGKRVQAAERWAIRQSLATAAGASAPTQQAAEAA